MGRIQTELNGISTTGAYDDGASYSLVNLRKKNGVLRPVSPRMVVQELSDDYDIIFVHQYLLYENWIGVKHISDTQDKIYWKILGTPEEISLNSVIPGGQVKINSIEQIGNTLSVITDSGIIYLLYNNEEYNVLGEIPEIRPIKYGIYSFQTPYFFEDEYSSVTKDTSQSAVTGMFNKSKKKIWDTYGACFFDAHLMVFAIRLFDGSYIKQSSPILLCHGKYPQSTLTFKIDGTGTLVIYDTENGNHVNKAFLTMGYYFVYLSFDTTYLEPWKDIIYSVDVFVSQGLGYNSESNIAELPSNEVPYEERPLLEDQSSMIQNIKGADNFYLISSIEIGEKALAPGEGSGERHVLPSKSSLDSLDILSQKERLPVDPFSHNKITGDVSYSYNRRLHLSNIKNTIFEGFNFDYFSLVRIFIPGYFNGYSLDDYSQYHYAGIMIAVDIKIEGQTKTVYSEFSKENSGGVSFCINPYFSYPDSRAFKARFYEMHGGNTYSLIKEITLTSSSHLNIAYYISEESTRAKPPVPDASGPQITIPIHDTDNTFFEPGKLKVSGINNPFVFPNENTYIVGNGKILSLATVAPRISEGSFGQYPLYVFTTSGVYAMSIGNEDVVYSKQSAPTSYEVPTTNIVCETPFGIAFTSERGLCMITGQEVQPLTDLIRESPKVLNIQQHGNTSGVLLNYGESKFIDFLRGIEFILYNPLENELIISDKESPFNYVLNLDSRQFYQSTEKIDLVVRNIFPQLKVIEDRKLKDYYASDTPDAHVSLISRPLLYGTPDWKRLERMILRATIFDVKNTEGGKKTHILNYLSIDGVKFDILRGIPVNPGSYKDLDMGLFSRSKYRQFLFAFAGIIDEKSQIEYLETEIQKEYENTKMR